MLVSSIARFNAINNMNSAAFGMMNASNQAMSMMNTNAFGGEHNLGMLHEMDKKISLDLASNSLLYKLAYLQDKALAKHQALEHKTNRLDVLA